MSPEIYFPNLGIKINELNRVAFTVFGKEIYFYGLIIVSAILIGYFAIEYTLKKQNEKIDDYLDLIIFLIIFSVIGARCYYVIFSWDSYKDNLLEIFNFRNGGLGIYGAVLSAILVVIIYSKVTKKDLFKIVDLFVPYLALGQAMGRWGNFFNKEAFGSATHSLFSMAIRVDSVRMLPESLKDSLVNYFDATYVEVHPTFLYESICSFIIFGYLLYRYHHKHFDGEVFFSYLILYAFARFFIEGLRTDQLLICNIPVSQIVSIGLFIIGLTLFIIFKKKDMNKNKNDKNKNNKKLVEEK